MYSTGKKIFITLSMVIILFSVIGGIVGKVAKKDEVYRDLTNFSEVVTLIDRSYVEPVDLDHIFTGAMEGLAASLAPDACYLSPVEYEKFKNPFPDNGWHVGITFSKRLGYFIVISPWDESPAAKKGILAGDVIKAVNDIPSEKINIFQLEEIFGGQGKDVTLEVYREGLRKKLTFTIQKEKYTPPPPAVRMIDETRRMAYLRISSLDGTPPGEIGEALKKVQSMEPSCLLLDLRNLSGNDLDHTVAIADLFLQKGTIVTLKSRKYPEKSYKSGKGAHYPLPPLYILINRGTADGGEVLAAALAENGLGTLVGEKSFGMGTINEFLVLKDGSAIYLPVSKYITPGQHEINANGLDPEWKIERSDWFTHPETVSNKELLELELQKILEQIVNREKQQKAA